MLENMIRKMNERDAYLVRSYSETLAACVDMTYRELGEKLETISDEEIQARGSR